MYSDNEDKKNDEQSGSYGTDNGFDGYVRPDAEHNKDSAQANGSDANSGAGSGNSQGNHNTGGYGSYSSYGSQYGGAYNSQNQYGRMGNGQWNNGNTYSQGGYSGYNNPYANGAGGAATGKKNKNLWIIPVAVFLCLALCIGSFVLGAFLITDSVTDADTSVSGGAINGSNGSQSGQNGNSDSKDPYFAGGDFELEQLPSDSVYYTIPSVVLKTQDTVVEITTEYVTTGSYWGQYVTTGAGSGVIIKSFSEHGSEYGKGTYIITNNHVISGASNIKVTLRNGSAYAATLVATDEKTDIAVIHIDEVGLSEAEIGSSSSLLAGETVVVIGNPLGSLGGSVSSGIISSTERNIEIDGNIMKLLQTTAAVNPGNSGGAMFDLEGRLVGIVNAKYSDEEIEGIGFAIPIDTAVAVADDLVNYGYVKGRTNLGITPYYGYCTYGSTYVNYDGVRVQGLWASEILNGSDAEKIGLEAYDYIASVQVDGESYTFTSAAAFTAFADTLKIGDEITIKGYRFTPRSSAFGAVSFKRDEISFTIVLTEYGA